MVEYEEYVNLYNQLHPTTKDRKSNPILPETSGLYWEMDYKTLRRQNLVQREGVPDG